VRSDIIPRSRKHLWNGYPVLDQESQNHDPVGRHICPYRYCGAVPPGAHLHPNFPWVPPGVCVQVCFFSLLHVTTTCPCSVYVQHAIFVTAHAPASHHLVYRHFLGVDVCWYFLKSNEFFGGSLQLARKHNMSALVFTHMLVLVGLCATTTKASRSEHCRVTGVMAVWLSFMLREIMLS